jgi:hypothetical protein
MQSGLNADIYIFIAKRIINVVITESISVLFLLQPGRGKCNFVRGLCAHHIYILSFFICEGIEKTIFKGLCDQNDNVLTQELFYRCDEI